jgi:polysaccharide biosynthesis/export protein
VRDKGISAIKKSAITKAATAAVCCLGIADCASQGGDGAFHLTAGQAVQAQSTQPAMALSGDLKPASDKAQAAQPAAAPSSDLKSASNVSEYRIMPGDMLQVVVYQVPDFSRDVQVDAAGNMALPLLGAIPAQGRSVHDLEADVAARLKAKYVQNPQVSISVKDAVGLRVTVQGAVKKPGVIQLRGDVTLTSVIAQSDGFSDTADQSAVLIIRNTDQGRVAAKVDAGAILTGSAPDPKVLGGDMIVVEDSAVKKVFNGALTVLSGAASARVLFP